LSAVSILIIKVKPSLAVPGQVLSISFHFRWLQQKTGMPCITFV